MEAATEDSAQRRERIFERRIVHWCAPTLAGAKPANLFTFVFEDGPACRSCPADGCRELTRRAFSQALKACRERLKPAGIGVDAVTVRRGGALLFVYRKDLLKQRLQEPEVAAFLVERGYNPFDGRGCISEISHRIRRMDRGVLPQGYAASPTRSGFCWVIRIGTWLRSWTTAPAACVPAHGWPTAISRRRGHAPAATAGVVISARSWIGAARP